MIATIGLGGRQLMLQGYVDPAEGLRPDAGEPGMRHVLFMDDDRRKLVVDTRRRVLAEAEL